jgi:two-component system cell cycle sensor histidine kinase/response regulator CckA
MTISNKVRPTSTRARFRALVENSWDAIAVFGTDGRILYGNHATERVLGYSLDELVNRNAFDFIRPDAHELVTRQLRASVRRPGERVEVSVHFLHRDGSWRLLEGMFTNMVDDSNVGGIVYNYRDMTEQRRNEERVGWLTLAVDQGPASVIMTDVAGKIVYVNQKFTDDSGYTSNEVLGKKPSVLKSGLTPVAQYAMLWRTIKSGKRYRGELQNRRKNGELYWNDVQISPVKDRHGAITHFLGVQTDITSHKKSHAELRETNDRFLQLADNISEVFFIMDAQFRQTLYINAAYEKIWGRTQQSLYDDPESFLDPIPPDDRDRLLASIVRMQFGEHPPTSEFRVVHPDGTTRWVLWHAVPIRNEKGEVYRISGVARDITERREAQLALEESLERFRKLTEASFDAICVSQDGIIREVNRGLIEMLGFDSENEVVGQRVVDLIAPQSAEEVNERVTANIEGTYELVVRRRDGKTIVVEATAKSQTIGGNVVRITALRDLTERRVLEEQFRQAQKMEAVGRLAGGVAHDFNNLLTVITGFTDMLLAKFGNGDPRRADLEEVRKAAEAAATLTRQLLAFSRQQVIEPKVVVLEDVVRQTQKLLTHLIGEDIELATQFGSQPCVVCIDPGQLEQVIMNLVVNSRDAMPTGGKLTIETAVVDLDEDYASAHWPATTGRYAMLAVSDTGVGMDESIRGKIFEPFFTTKEPGKGTGLGLATVYGIVKQSGGFVWAYSEPGKGATFKVYLPLWAEASPPTRELPPRLSSPCGAETVLLVEDSQSVRRIVRRTLEQGGYNVIDAPSGKAALELAARLDRPVDLLLTDVVMPDMSGRVLAEEFAALQPNTKVLYMSGYTDDAVIRHGILRAKTHFLQKPFTPLALATRMREVLDS